MPKSLQGVTIRSPVVGKVKIAPRLILKALGDQWHAISWASPSDIAPFLIAPVIEINKKSTLHQEVRDGWDRVFKKTDFSNSNIKPLIISARKNWNLFNDELNIIESAFIIDGAQKLDYFLIKKIQDPIPLIIFFNKTEKDEMLIRRAINGGSSFSIHDIKNKIGTEAPRLTIDNSWKDIKILSDPFVIKSAFGYTAAINVLDKKSNIFCHIIVGAKSLSNDLELIRLKNETLVGVDIKIRKESTDPKSIYEIKLIK